MKRFVTTLLLLVSMSVLGNGVGIIDATTGTYLHLAKSDVEVNVESQIAITKATHWLVNTQSTFVNVKYGFPLGEDASAIDLRWKANGVWFQADVNEQPADTTLPGSGGTTDQALIDHLGATPLYFDIPDTVFTGDTLVVELSYVELLPYSFGKVNYLFRNNYSLLQSSSVDRQEFFFTLNSPRTINVIQLQSGQTLSHLTNNGNLAEIGTRDIETQADADYAIEYELDQNQLGLFGFSTLIPDSTLPDNLGGFFTFIAEPDPTSTATIDKVFTLIIDRSGSMSGDKIVQARNAATFIVNNLNTGDRFNIVDFSSTATSFNSEHVDFNATTQQQALNYIGQINANGGTNISRAFDLAMPQFGAANNSTANIIIFFTDGRANGGISNTQALLAHIQQLQNQTSANVGIFTFGIGSNVNTQLLTLMASQNGGLSEFLGNDELFS
ncbi:MAG: VWA domain-containing protein, partial [Calditrichota bacterium]